MASGDNRLVTFELDGIKFTSEPCSPQQAWDLWNLLDDLGIQDQEIIEEKEGGE